MYLANELDVNGRLLRGNVRMPDAGGPFPTIVFLHGFTVWKTGPQRLYEEFVRMAVRKGFCVVRYDFYGTGESEGEFYEMTIGSEMNETAAIYKWASEQPYVDVNNMFLGGHSLGALLALVEAPHIQPKATFGWSTALTMLFQAGQRTRTMRGPTERGWDIDGLELSREFMDECAGMDFLLGLGKTKITLIINFTRIFLLRIPVLMILQHLIADGATALGIMMLISNGCCAILTTSICIAVSRNLLRTRTVQNPA